ncbi:MAG TPA: VWA domain-containing protein, partial [Solirubrobacterales bacterium]
MRSRSLLFLMVCMMARMAGAQEPVPAFEEMIDVRAVNLEAVVTDSRGNRVTGLAAEDFKLFVDGIETPITFFSPVEEERRIAGEVDGDGEAQPEWQSRNILVFLDEASMMKSRRNLVVRSVIKQIEDLGSGDQMAVVAFDGLRLDVLSDWTADKERLVAVLREVRQRPSAGIYIDAARRAELNDAAFANLAASQEIYDRNPGGSFFTSPAGAAPSSPPSKLAVEEEIHSVARWQEPLRFRPTQLFNPLDRYLGAGEAAAGAMRGMSAPEGRRMMMLLTEGFQDPVFALPVVHEAQRLGYSLYPVDVMGIDTFRAQNDVSFAAPQAFSWISTPLDVNTNYTLDFMADATGGKAAINSNRIAALERLIEDSSSYYLIGFSPTWRGDDRRHGIRLDVARKGLKIRTRDSYVDSSRRTRLALAADASLLLGRSQQEQRLIVIVDRSVGNEVSISLGVPVESLAFAPQEKGFRAETPFALVVLDDEGKRKHL